MQVCYLSLGAGLWFSRKLDLCGFEDGVFLENILLRLVVTERLENKEKHMKTNTIQRSKRCFEPLREASHSLLHSALLIHKLFHSFARPTVVRYCTFRP